MSSVSKLSTNGPSQRQLRVGEQVRQIISDILLRNDFHNDVLASAHVSISDVVMSPDLRHGRVYVLSLMAKDMSETVAALNEHEVQIRQLMAKEMTMKFLPKLRFYVDDAHFEASKIDALFKSDHVAQDLEEADNSESESQAV